MEKRPHSSALIRFQDCDPHGHLNNSKYLDYLINAREDHLVKYYNLDIFAYMRTHGRGWVVGKNEILYKKPALVMETVGIRSQVLNYSEKHIEVEIAMYDQAMKQLKALMWSTFVHIDARKGSAVPHDAELMGLMENVHLPVDAGSIEERVLHLHELVG